MLPTRSIVNESPDLWRYFIFILTYQIIFFEQTGYVTKGWSGPLTGKREWRNVPTERSFVGIGDLRCIRLGRMEGA